MSSPFIELSLFQKKRGQLKASYLNICINDSMSATVASSTVPSGPKGNAFIGTEGVYHLPHHQKEIERLQKQHDFFLSSTNGVLLTVPVYDKLDWRVLDSGAADGKKHLRGSNNIPYLCNSQ